MKEKRKKCDQWIKHWFERRNQQEQSLKIFYKQGFLKNCAKFTGKYLCWSLFLIKFNELLMKFLMKPVTLLKRDSSKGVFW